MSFLITGATGKTGSGVVRRLRAAGESVRVVVRDQERARKKFAGLGPVDVVEAALDDPEAMARAFDGVDTAFLALGSSPDQARLEKSVIDAGIRAGLGHLVKLSGWKTAHGTPTVAGRLHADIEDHLAASGLAHTLLRPSVFMTNLLAAGPSVAATAQWSGAVPTGRVTYVDLDDLTEASTAVLRDRSLQGGVHWWSGLRAHTTGEISGLLTGILGHEVRYLPVSPDELRSRLLAQGVPAWTADLVVSLDVGAEAGRFDHPTTALRDLLGREPRTLEDFLTEHADAFTGTSGR